MFCGHCGETLAAGTSGAEPCPACGEPPLLDGRYRLEAIVGRGAAGITYRAIRVEDGRQVAVKEMQFHRVDAEKVRALYTREANVLRQLDHPRIPDYVDHFVAGSGKHRSLYLAQTFIDGQALAAERGDRRYREEEVLAIIAEVAGILVYLHDLRPPVIHRDIKPGNIMRRAADGALVLVDFGAVRDALADPAMGGSTVVGTFGFMAPEQYRGDASPASDLYALGITAAVLLSRQSADALSDVPGQVDWRAHLDVHPETAALLDDLLEPSPERRLGDARRLVARAEHAIEAIERDRAAASRAPARAPIQRAPVRPPPLDPGPLGFDFGPSHGERTFDDAPPASTRTGGPGLAIAASLLMVAIIAAVVFATVEEPHPMMISASTSAPLEACDGSACRAPHGLKGLEFGMTVDRARAALPDFTDETPEPIPVHISGVALTGDPLGALIGHRVDLGGAAYTVETRLGALPTTCRLEFAVDDTLSRMRCTLEAQPDLGSHTAAEEALHGGLVSRYGPPASASNPADEHIMGVTHRASATWSDGEADAELSSSFQSFAGMGHLPPKSEIALENTSAAHRALLEAAEGRARDEVRADRAARDAESRRQAEALRRRIEQQKGNLTDDL